MTVPSDEKVFHIYDRAVHSDEIFPDNIGMKLPLIISKDTSTIETVVAAAAALDIRPSIANDREQIVKYWLQASVVIISEQMAPLVSSLSLAWRANIYICGSDARQLARWSVSLNGSIIVLPDQVNDLAQILSQQRIQPVSGAKVISVIGGSGGVGASTLAASLARIVSKDSQAVLVEADPCGGGIDLLFGAEDEPGWRWNDLGQASGYIGNLSGRLPRVDGVDLLAVQRRYLSAKTKKKADDFNVSDTLISSLSVEAFTTVMDSLSRSYDSVIVDGEINSFNLEWLNPIRIVVVAAHIRGVMAARSRILNYHLSDAWLVIRRSSYQRIDPGFIEQTLAMPIAGIIPYDRHVAQAMETGEPPGRRRGRYQRACREIVGKVVGDER